MSIGKKIGVISDYSQYPIQFRDFSNLETVHYFTEQLRQDKRKNTKWDIHNLSPTQKSYLYALWNFSNWLHGKEFESNALIQTDLNEFKKIKSKTTLEDFQKDTGITWKINSKKKPKETTAINTFQKKKNKQEILNKINQMHVTDGKSFKQIKDELTQMEKDEIIPNMGYEDK